MVLKLADLRREFCKKEFNNFNAIFEFPLRSLLRRDNKYDIFVIAAPVRV